MLLESDDANAHERGPEHDWRESYYCNFCDPHSDLCGVAWQGARPNAGHGEAVFVLCDGASNLIRSVDPHVPIAPSADPARKIGSQEFVCVESWRRWDVRFEQPEAKKVYEQYKIPIDTLADRVRNVVQSAFNGKRIVIFSGGEAKGTNEVLEEVRQIAAGGGFGSIMGRNCFQRPRDESLKLLGDAMAIYKK